eukprot:765107-Hanusia_phi.AAC.2
MEFVAAALERRSQFRDKAKLVAAVLQAERKEHAAKINKLKEFDDLQKRQHRQFLLDSMQDSKLLQRLPHYTHVAMILLGLRRDAPEKEGGQSARCVTQIGREAAREEGEGEGRGGEGRGGEGSLSDSLAVPGETHSPSRRAMRCVRSCSRSSRRSSGDLPTCSGRERRRRRGSDTTRRR